MFFKLRNDTKLQVRFVSYAKIPYAGNILNVFRTSYKPYSNLIRTIHCVKKKVMLHTSNQKIMSFVFITFLALQILLKQAV